jgi:hypothetical protein
MNGSISQGLVVHACIFECSYVYESKTLRWYYELMNMTTNVEAMNYFDFILAFTVIAAVFVGIHS